MPVETFWTRDLIAYAAYLWYRKHGTWPRRRDWTSTGEDHPVFTTVYKSFTNWEDLIEDAKKLEESIYA